MGEQHNNNSIADTILVQQPFVYQPLDMEHFTGRPPPIPYALATTESNPRTPCFHHARNVMRTWRVSGPCELDGVLERFLQRRRAVPPGQLKLNCGVSIHTTRVL
jgi:hypothetical protein